MKMSFTYLSTHELSDRIKYNPRTMRNKLMGSVLKEGRHFIRPFGQRRILFIWEHIEEDMCKSKSTTRFSNIAGDACHA
jgi:thermostable 8-oxoguanine DNA glycosylase